MANDSTDEKLVADDVRTLHRLGYAQELARCLGAFSNFAISLSIICILSGGITSFHVGYCSVGGAAIGIGWPLVALFALVVAMAMGQIASAFPTAGGLYHWASILGGRGFGWFTAWFNLAGLVTVLAAINVGTFQFARGALFPNAEVSALTQLAIVAAMTASQALINHLGIRLTARLTDFSGYLIFVVAALLTLSLLAYAPSWDWQRLVNFANFSGLPEAKPVWPSTSTAWLFALGFLLPAYTITGFDASAHAAEETVGADRRVPRGIVGAVLVSGIAGWIMLGAAVLAIPDMDNAAEQGDQVFFAILNGLPPFLRILLYPGILMAQYLCGLATVTSASRMAFAFARDGGLPSVLRYVSPSHRTPVFAIWAVSISAVLFTVFTPVYETITVVCTIFLYISYTIPIGLGFLAYNRSWTRMGPWNLGVWYRPLAAISVLGCIGFLVIGVQPPNEIALPVVGVVALCLLLLWVAFGNRYFPGPPQGVLDQHRLDEIHQAEAVVHQAPIAEEGATMSDDLIRTPDEFLAAVRARTPARILVGRSGPAYLTSTWLDLREDHAAALDAVHAELELPSEFVEQFGLFEVQTQAASKQEYLLRPDLGRRLHPDAGELISQRCVAGADVQIVVADGLSAAAVHVQVPILLPLLISELGDLKLGQPFVVRHARVGVMNDIGARLQPAVLVLLIGERPGLATAESLSAYLAYRPNPGHTDAHRNLISNIHARGVPIANAAQRIAALCRRMIEAQTSGFGLKEEMLRLQDHPNQV